MTEKEICELIIKKGSCNNIKGFDCLNCFLDMGACDYGGSELAAKEWLRKNEGKK